MSTTLSRDEAELFVVRESRLIDDRQFGEWLALFADDCLYWVPINEGDPAEEPSLIYDDCTRMKERVYRLTSATPPSQEPASRTLHNVSNVEVFDHPGGVRIRCNLTIFEFRPGDPSQVGLADQRVFAARAEYLLREDPRWRITLKKVWLLTRDAPQYNLTFIF